MKKGIQIVTFMGIVAVSWLLLQKKSAKPVHERVPRIKEQVVSNTKINKNISIINNTKSFKIDNRKTIPFAIDEKDVWMPKFADVREFDNFFGFEDESVDEQTKNKMYVRLAEMAFRNYLKPDRGVFLNIVTNALLVRPNITEQLLEKIDLNNSPMGSPFFELVLGERGHLLAHSDHEEDLTELERIRNQIRERLSMSKTMILPIKNMAGEIVETESSTLSFKRLAVKNLVAIGDQTSFLKLQQLKGTEDYKFLKYEIDLGLKQLEFELGYTDRHGHKVDQRIDSEEESLFRKYVLLRNRNQFVFPVHIGTMGRLTRVEMKYNFINNILRPLIK